MTQPLTLADVVSQLAEGQRHLQLVLEQQTKAALQDKQAFQDALQSQASMAANNQVVQDTALLCLTDVITNARVHPNVPSAVLQKYREGDDPDFFFCKYRPSGYYSSLAFRAVGTIYRTPSVRRITIGLPGSQPFRYDTLCGH